MSAFDQIWLVASRELRERSRSRAFLASLIIMVLVAVGTIVAPAFLDDSDAAKRVGLAGEFSPALAPAIETQGDVSDVGMEIRHFSSVAEGQHAVRDGDIHLLVVDGVRLEWQRRTDEELRAVAVSAISHSRSASALPAPISTAIRFAPFLAR